MVALLSVLFALAVALVALGFAAKAQRRRRQSNKTNQDKP